MTQNLVLCACVLFGSYAFRATEPKVFIREIVGTDGHFTVDEINEQLRNIIVSRFPDSLAEAQIAALDLAANYDELGEKVQEKISEEFADYGLELTKLLVENVSLPPEVEQALDRRSSMNMVGNLGQYTQFQAANAIGDAANNDGMGGLAAGGMAAGLGMAMGNVMAQNLQQPAQTAGSAGGTVGDASAGAPPPLPTAVQWYLAVNGQQVGPLQPHQLAGYVQAGQLAVGTLMWKNGMAAWTPAGQIPELAGLFAPPLHGCSAATITRCICVVSS